MTARSIVLAFALLAASVPLAARAAASAQALTPINQSIAGGESQTFSVRFFDALGHPAAGESVVFANDACGVFQNGRIQASVLTDATGTASARFTAASQGITCWLVASAGVQVQFNVLTYIPSNVYLTAGVPTRILPGESFGVPVSAMYGGYKLYNQDITARIVPGTSTATISPAAANTGQDGVAGFTVTPEARTGDYQIEIQFRDHVQRFAVAAADRPWQDMWWAGWDENGWGMSIVQHGDMLFSVVYAYDAAGKPIWYVMPGGTWNAARTVFSGALYLPHGTPSTAYDASKLSPGSAIGTASLDFGDPANVRLSYTIAGISAQKSISRQPFGLVDMSGGVTVGDMWWGGPTQNGWGLAVLQQFRTLFGVWFTYDAGGSPTWLVMPSGFWSDAQTWEGHIYRTTGSAWLGEPYDKTLLKSTDAGTFRLRFSGDTATFDYTVDGRSGSVPISRQPF